MPPPSPPLSPSWLLLHLSPSLPRRRAERGGSAGRFLGPRRHCTKAAVQMDGVGCGSLGWMRA
eukprot:13490253-Alexandrium_andersonii.AAC.1